MEIVFSSETQNRLERVAALRGRDSGALVAEAVERMLDYEEWVAKAVREGIDEADRGELIDHEEVEKMIERRFHA